jgi:hypothetical protein
VRKPEVVPGPPVYAVTEDATKRTANRTAPARAIVLFDRENRHGGLCLIGTCVRLAEDSPTDVRYLKERIGSDSHLSLLVYRLPRMEQVHTFSKLDHF